MAPARRTAPSTLTDIKCTESPASSRSFLKFTAMTGQIVVHVVNTKLTAATCPFTRSE